MHIVQQTSDTALAQKSMDSVLTAITSLAPSLLPYSKVDEGVTHHSWPFSQSSTLPKRAFQTSRHMASETCARNLQSSVHIPRYNVCMERDSPSTRLAFATSSESAGRLSSSLRRSPTVGTVSGSNWSTCAGSTGTHTLPGRACQLSCRSQVSPVIFGRISVIERTGPWMNTEWSFQQMVTMLRDFSIDSRICILEDDVLHCSLELFLSPWSATATFENILQAINPEELTASG